MISYYSSSSDPAQLRGKTVYLQYSNRQEIVHNKTAGDVTGNVLLVTIEGVEPYDVSIDVLHLVFSTFGFVQKIATFEKTAGFQALVQFADQETASTARVTLDGRSIPSYLLPQHVNLCTLKITFSGHTDLNVKFQSHRSRDYTNPSLPVAPSAIDGSGQFTVGLDGNKQEESNVLLASIENMQYAVNVDVLHTVFSSFGAVQKIAMFENNSGTHALIQYPDTQSAIGAKQALEGHPIYEGGYCKLRLSYSRHTDLSVKVNNDRSRDYTQPNLTLLDTQPSILGQQPTSTAGHTAPVYSGVSYPQVSGPQYAPEASQISGLQYAPEASQVSGLQYAQVSGIQYAQVSGPQYAPGASQVVAPPQAVAGWGMNTAQPMAQMYPNNMYIAPPGTVQYDMQQHMTMQMPAQNGQPPVTAMPPYGH